MREVAIIGIGETKVREHWDRSLRELAVESTLAAMANAGIEKADALFVGNMLSGELAGQEHLAALIADFAGLGGIEAVKVEAACGSGGAAVRAGYLAVASGLHDLVLVTGVEKMTDTDNGVVTEALASASDADYEAFAGLSFVAINALLMHRYMYQYKVKHEDFAWFSVNAHKNAANNPYAIFRSPITLDDFVKARMIVEPINLMDSSPIADGAATVVLCQKDKAKDFTPNPIGILGSGSATDTIALHNREDPLFLTGAHASAHKAYAQADLKAEDIDLFELHDAFTIMAALSLEACGFAPPGRGVQLAVDGEISLEGRIPISTMGGLKGRGHPVGASGVYQIVELVQQLRGEAGANQVDCRLGMAQSIGGSGATAVTHILEAAE